MSVIHSKAKVLTSFSPTHLLPRETAYLAMTIAFDCAIFLLIAYVTFQNSSQEMAALPSTALLKTILRDGAAYFFVLLSGNFIWMMLALFARVR